MEMEVSSESCRAHLVPTDFDVSSSLIASCIFQVGQLKFNPSLGCKKQCYTGLAAASNGKDLCNRTDMSLLSFHVLKGAKQLQDTGPFLSPSWL